MISFRRNKKESLADRLAPYTYPTITVVESDTPSMTVIAKYPVVFAKNIRTLLSR